MGRTANFLFILALPIAIALPWVVHSSSTLTMGGYDLAEWLSLHPNAQADRFLPLILRGQLALITWLIILHAEHRFTARWWLSVFLSVLMIIAQLPPLEFFTNFGQDSNQLQQFQLATITLVGIILIMMIKQRFYVWITCLIALLGIISSTIANSQFIGWMTPYKLDVEIGIGAILILAVYAVILFRNAQVLIALNKTG